MGYITDPSMIKVEDSSDPKLRQDVDNISSQLAQLATTPKDFGAKGDGVSNDTTAFNSMLSYCNSNGIKTVRMTKGIYVVDDLTIPENIKVIVDNGAMFYINNSKTLTINGEIEAGSYQIFDWNKGLTLSGSLVTSISYSTWGLVKGKIQSSWIYPQWWGAVADGLGDGITGTDNYYAFKALSLYVNSAKQANINIPKGIYFIMQYNINQQMVEWLNLTQLRISGYGVKFDFYNSINRTSTSGTYGNLSLFQIKDCQNIVLEGFEIDHNGDKATSSNNTNSASRSSIEFWRTNNVTVRDVETKYGFSAGIAIWTDCQDFMLENVKAQNFSWGSLIIENLINGTFRKCDFNYGGKCGVVPRIPQSCGVLIEAHNGSVDNVVFENCTIKGAAGSQVYISSPEYIGTVRFVGGTVATDVDSFVGAFALKCRNGIVDGVFFDLSNGGFIRALGYDTTNDAKATYERCTILTKSKGIEHVGDVGTLIIDNNRMIHIDTGAPTGTSFPLIQSSSTIFRNNYLFYPASLLDVVNTGRENNAIFHRVLLAENNTFETDLNTDEIGTDQFLYVNFDGAKQLVNNQFISPNNKSIRCDTNYNNDYAFTRRDKRFSVYGESLGLVSNATIYNIMYGGAAPSSGTYNKGDIVLNRTASAGGKIGWVCVTSGTPGTWKAFGAIDA